MGFVMKIYVPEAEIDFETRDEVVKAGNDLIHNYPHAYAEVVDDKTGNRLWVIEPDRPI